MIKKTAFLSTKIEVNKPDLRRLYLQWCLISEMQGRV